MRIRSISHSTVTLLLKHPVHFLLIQLPAGLTEPLEVLTTTFQREHDYLAPLLILPVFFVLSIFTSAATFASVLRNSQSKPLSLKETFDTVVSHGKPLLLAAMLVGSLSALGMMAYVIPALLIITVYLFVPHLILSKGGLAVTAYLNQSKDLTTQSRRRFLFSFGIVFCAFLISLASDLLGKYLGQQFLEPDNVVLFKMASWIGIRMLLTMFLGSIIDVWISFYFLEVRDK